MEKYIKANAKVAKFLHLDTIRNAVKDGNYLLWIMDVQEFGAPADLPQILTQIGGILLTGAEAREEQDGVVTRNLPMPTDKRFIIDSEDNGSAIDKNVDSADSSKGDVGESDEEGGSLGDEGGNSSESNADADGDSKSDLGKEGGSDE